MDKIMAGAPSRTVQLVWCRLIGAAEMLRACDVRQQERITNKENILPQLINGLFMEETGD
ncbi:hypothetical protein [Duganella sp. Dugasp56]|uniref:hypothetical protein n=1 Tax=Duganella sp. Dugasp56 TaxID=3243046 RepID=UPI0039AFFE61